MLYYLYYSSRAEFDEESIFLLKRCLGHYFKAGETLRLLVVRKS
jgi:hypothetical protein